MLSGSAMQAREGAASIRMSCRTMPACDSMTASIPLNAASCRRCRGAEDEGIAIARKERMGPQSDRLRSVVTSFIGLQGHHELLVALNDLPAARSAA